MGRYYLVADEHGWHHALHRADMRFDCVQAVHDQEPLRWASVLTAEQHADLVRQWMLRTDDAPLADEWIPAEWLLRAWGSPAMAAAESGHVSRRARLFEIEARPVMLGRSIPVTIPELSLTGIDEFRVVREVPSWWLMGPCGREAFAVLVQFQALSDGHIHELSSAASDLSILRLRALDVIDAMARVGAYALARAAISDTGGRSDAHSQLALSAVMGLILKDVWPEAQRLYRPWVRQHGVPDLDVGVGSCDLPYPSAAPLL